MKVGWTLMIGGLLIVLSSCVSVRKYEDMEAWKNRVQRQYDETSEDLTRQQAELAQVKEKAAELEATKKKQTADLQEARQRYEDLDRTNRDLMTRYDRMLAQNQQMLESSSSDKQLLTSQLTLKEQELARREQQITQNQNRLNDLEKELDARSRRVDELESAMAEKDAKIKAIREKVNQALLGFSAADLTVREQNGKVYVSLSQNLLFPSGSKVINRPGKDAINKLAQVLKGNPDIAITVEGHTDSDGDAALNWDLSVGRATSVVKELTASGVDPKRITAAGRGEYFPIATNGTANGKAQNRRTEIILTPRLDALYELIGQ